MKCQICGNLVADGTVFCGNCGNKTGREKSFCSNCGSAVEANAVFCGACGMSVNGNGEQDTKTQFSEPVQPLSKRVPKHEKKNSSTPIILALITIIVLLLAVIVGYIIYSNISDNKASDNNQAVVTATDKPERDKEDDEEEEETPTENVGKVVTEEPTEILTEAPSRTTVAVDSNGYATYTSNKYGFSCKYPSWFGVDNDSESYFSCSTEDGLGSMIITCTDTGGLAVSDHMDICISQVGGTVDYKASGSNYFAVRMKLSSYYYYQYSHFKNGKIYSFAFNFPLDEFDTYDSMINHIYTPFYKQF